MAFYIRILYILTGLTGVQSITTVSKVSVKAGKSISIPCLYDSRYINHVKYVCEGYYWNNCNYAVKTNAPENSGKYSISDDKKKHIFNVTINQLTNKNTDYWCAVEINGGADERTYFHLSFTSGTPSLYVDHQKITGYIGENITITCHHSNSGELKWCRQGGTCVTGSSGLIDGTRVTTHRRDPNNFTVTMSGLRLQDSGWYWCAKGDVQMPVNLTVTEKPITTTAHSITGDGTITTSESEQHRPSFDPKSLIIPLSVLILAVIVVLFIWFILRHKQSKAKSSATAMSGEDVTYSEVKPKKKRSGKEEEEEATYSNVGYVGKKLPERPFTESGVEIMYSSVVTMKKQSVKRQNEGKGTEVTYTTLANRHTNI